VYLPKHAFHENNTVLQLISFMWHTSASPLDTWHYEERNASRWWGFSGFECNKKIVAHNIFSIMFNLYLKKAYRGSVNLFNCETWLWRIDRENWSNFLSFRIINICRYAKIVIFIIIIPNSSIYNNTGIAFVNRIGTSGTWTREAFVINAIM
jgi:hypothetical protein